MAAEEQGRYWVEGIRYRAAHDPVAVAYARPKCELISRWAGLSAGSTVLDVGTGNGTLFYSLAERFQCWGIDSSAHLLASHCAPRRVQRASAYALPYRDRSVDLAVESCMLHHVSRPESVVLEMARVARRALVLIEPNMLNPISLAFHALVPAERGALRLSRRRLRALVPPAFTIRFARAVGLVYPNRTPGWLAALLERMDRPCPLGNVNVVIATREE
jgi:SAM-dependent methyltransferase